MEKRQFRIGQLAQQLDVERFVIRFWEKEFNIASHRSPGGQRFYTEDDLNLFSTIKTLLYDHGFTIAGAKQHMHKKAPTEQFIASKKDHTVAPTPSEHGLSTKTKKQLIDFKKQLIKLQNLL